MAQTAHTPGPWIVDNFLCDADHPLRVAMPPRAGMPTATIARCEHNWSDAGPYDRRISWKEAEANTLLIAAAPDLLETLTALADEAFLNMRDGRQDLIDDARRAIAKATGA